MCEKEQKRERPFCTAGNLLTTIASRISVINKSDYRTGLTPTRRLILVPILTSISILDPISISISICTVHINQMKLTERERANDEQQIEC